MKFVKEITPKGLLLPVTAARLSGFGAGDKVEYHTMNRYVEYRIGKMYAGGLGTDQDDTSAAEWFSKAARQRYKYAQYSLAGLYSRGKGVLQDDKKALELYVGAAVQGFPYAAWELGKRYRDGVGCVPDERQASRYFSMAYRGFDEITVRQMASNIKVVNKDTLMICFKDGIEIMQTIDRRADDLHHGRRGLP